MRPPDYSGGQNSGTTFAVLGDMQTPTTSKPQPIKTQPREPHPAPQETKQPRRPTPQTQTRTVDEPSLPFLPIG